MLQNRYETDKLFDNILKLTNQMDPVLAEIDQLLSLTALRAALANRTPQIHRSDQGVQYAAHAYIDLLRAYDIQVSMAAVGKAEENGYAERFMRTIKEEEVDLSDYRDFRDAFDQIGRFIEDLYMTRRIHSALGYLTPLEASP